MPFALVIIGLVMIVSGARNTHQQLGAALTKDFTGPHNFFNWMLAIGAVGALGYIDEFRKFSTTFMALIITAMVIRNGGVFDKFTQAIASAHPATAAVAGGAQATASTGGGQSGTVEAATKVAAQVAPYVLQAAIAA